MYVTVVPLKRLPGSFQYFTYEWEEKLGTPQPGLLVMVPWRSGKLLGLVWQVDADLEPEIAAEKIKKVAQVINPEPFMNHARLCVAEEISALYKVSLSAACTFFLPPQKSAKLKKIALRSSRAPQQMRLVTPMRPKLLWYDASSIEVCTHHAARENIKRNKQTAIVFPYRTAVERWIAACPARIRKHMIWYDGALTPKTRFDAWMKIQQNPRAVVVGEHLALSAPMDFLETIIVVNEHANAHKQWDMAPRYHNRDLALSLSRATGAQLLLASPAPSIESLYAAETRRYTLLKSADRKTPQAPHTLIDLKNEFIKKNYTLISDYAWEKTLAALQEGGNVLYLLNKRGWGRVVGCRDCGFIARCRACNAAQVYHENVKELRCHHCRIKTSVPLKCPNCMGANLYIGGTGTEKISAELQKRLAEAELNVPVIHIDKDTADALTQELPKPPYIMIGTNAALTLLADTRLTLACVVNADRELARTEFRAQEELFLDWWNLGEQSDELIIQTTAPESPFLNRLSLRQFDEWAQDELSMRKRFTYPPFCDIVKLIIEAKNQASARRISEELAHTLKRAFAQHTGVSVGDATAGLPPITRGNFRYMIIVKLPFETNHTIAKQIAALVPDSCKVDFNPLSLFGD